MAARRTDGRRPLPLRALVQAYAARGVPTLGGLHRVPRLGGRFAAVLAATAKFLYADFLDRAPETAARDALVGFYRETCSEPLHESVLVRRIGFVRHAVGYLLHARESAPKKIDAVLSATGTYRVPGLGGSFWSAVLQGASPARYPAMTRETVAALGRLGDGVSPTSPPGEVYESLLRLHAQVREIQPQLTSLHIDHFLSLVSRMTARELPTDDVETPDVIAEGISDLRKRCSLRERIKERGRDLASARERFEEGLSLRDGKRLREAVSVVDPASEARGAIDWRDLGEELTLWLSRLWEADDPHAVAERIRREAPIPGAGPWLAAAVMHLRDAGKYPTFSDGVCRGLSRIDEGVAWDDPPEARYRLLEETAARLREKYALHPLETGEVLDSLGREDEGADDGVFGGFCSDTFAFLGELARENSREWMERARDRYHFAVREPLAELCRVLASRYVEPVLGGRHGWAMETDSRTGRAMTSVCKNDYGRSKPYTSTMWLTFCPRAEGRASAQLFVKLSPAGLRYGLRLGPTAKDARGRLRRNLERYGDAVRRLLSPADDVRYGAADADGRHMRDGADLAAWAAGKSQEAFYARDASEPSLTSPDLPGEILVAFDRLLPLFACAADEDAGAALQRLGAEVSPDVVPSAVYDDEAFLAETFLPRERLREMRELLSLKRQLILQGVPGTGKTHVALALAKLLARGCDEAVRVVQFHPAYAYEEFVEGIRVRTVNTDGRTEVVYPVEDGVLCDFAARASAKPSQPHVLVIDEINRGNLPKIFGELLYLLEYRGRAVELPYSRRSFRLPENVILLATMNAADRSITPLDQALRRRFSFVAMEPDGDALSAWLRVNAPGEGTEFAERVRGLFDRVNARLAAEGPAGAKVGHSPFMVAGMDEDKLRLVWRHQVRPMVEELLGGRAEKVAGFDALIEEKVRRREKAGGAT